jgi:serine protease Do
MHVFDKMRQQKLLSLTLLLTTLVIGIVIGTLVNTGVKAARAQAVAPDATPLTIPNPVVLGNEFTKLAKKLEPSVVYITADYTPKASEATPQHSPGEKGGDEGGDSDDLMEPFRRFFHGGPFGNMPPHAYKQEQSGTGFIVDKNGYIITNNHVVAKMDHLKVKLHTDGQEYRARVIGTDSETDLAVIKIDPREALVPVTIGNSDSVQVGDWAVAIGSPFGLDASVTAGIVSALGRDIGSQLQRFIQTDAAINPGNSGGPLLNIRGEVIGVNTMIATQSGAYQGIGFALPVNMVARVYNDIIKSGKVTRGSIGITWNKAAKPDLMKALGTNHGVLVMDVHKNGPAAKAGIKQDDIILAMNGTPVKDGDDLVDRVTETPIGTSVKVTIDRNGKRMEMPVVVEDRAVVFADDPRIGEMREPKSATPEEQAPTGVSHKFGIKIKPLTDADREAMGLNEKRGVMVVSVDQDSFADEIGMMERDIILSINRVDVSSPDDIRRLQATLKPGDAVAIRIMRSAAPDMPGHKKTWASTVLAGTLPIE